MKEMMARKCIISILGCIILIAMVTPSLAQTAKLDSLEMLIAQSDNIDTLWVDAYNDEAFEFLKIDPTAARNTIQKAKTLADSIGYLKGTFRALINEGSFYWMIGLHDKALKTYLSAEKLNVVHDQIGYYVLNNNIGEVFKKKQQYDSASIYLNKSWQTYLDSGVSIYPSLLASNIAELYLITDQYDSANYYYQKSFQLATLDKNDRSIAYALSGVAEILHRTGNIEKSEEMNLQALEIRRKINDKRSIILSLNALGAINLEQGEYKLAENYFLEAENIARAIKSSDLLINCYNNLANLYEANDQYVLANKWLRISQQLNDSIESIVFVDRIANLESALESEINEAENQALLNEQASYKKKIRNQVVITLIVIGFFLFVLGYLYQYNKRLKLEKRHNQQLKKLNHTIYEKNQEIRKINYDLDQENKLKGKNLEKINEELLEKQNMLSDNLHQQEKLAESLMIANRMLQQSQDISKMGSWDYNPETKKMNWTPQTYKQLGLTDFRQEPTMDLLQKCLSAGDFKKLNIKLTKIKNGKEHQELVLHITQPDKSIKHINVRLVGKFDDEGQLISIFGSNIDITDVVALNEKENKISQTLLLLAQLANLKHYNFDKFIEMLISQSAEVLGVERVGFWFYNQQGKFINNYKSYDLQTKEFTAGSTLHEKDYPKYFEAIYKNRTVAVHDAMSDLRTQEFVDNYFSEFDIVSLLDGQILNEGELLGIICVEKCHDQKTWTMSDQRFVGSMADIIATAYSTYQNIILENEKEELITELVNKNERLEEFAYVISHNLRGPVAGMKGLLQLYNHPTTSTDLIPNIIGHLKDSASNLDKVINDLSTVLRNQEKLDESMEEVVLMECIEMCKTSLETPIDELCPIFEYHFNKDFKFTTQKAYLYNIMYNLLSNALKYHDESKRLKIEISAELDNEYAVISIKDNGIGLDLNKFKDKLFKMYQRFHLGVEGRGIGLYIAKNQINSLGGDIEVESRPGFGSKFTIKLPAQITENSFTHLIKNIG